MMSNLQLEQNNKITQYCTSKLQQTKQDRNAVIHSEITHPVVAPKTTVKIVQSGPATQQQYKISMSPFDNKRYLINNKETIPHCTEKIRNEILEEKIIEKLIKCDDY